MIHLVRTSEPANYDLRGFGTVFYTNPLPRASLYQVRLLVGTIANPCLQVPGVWKLGIRILTDEWRAVEPDGQEIFCADNFDTKEFITITIPLAATNEIMLLLQSPHEADSSVAVTGTLWDVAYALPDALPGDAGGLPTVGSGLGQINPTSGAVPSSNMRGTDGAITSLAGIATLAKQDAAALILARMAGLVQENFYIDNYVWSTGRCTSFRMRIYSDAASVGTAANVLATYNVTATYTAGREASYKVVKA